MEGDAGSDFRPQTRQEEILVLTYQALLNEGDWRAGIRLIEQYVGKPKETIEQVSKPSDLDALERMSLEELDAEIARLRGE